MTKSKTTKLLAVVVLVIGIFVAGYSCWRSANPRYPFSQAQYDEGYYMAFRANSTGPGQICFKQEAWSQGKGFDDGREDFERIYQHPNVGPFSYNRIDRLRDVINHIEKSDALEPTRKKVIVEQLKADLKGWETQENRKNGE